MWHFARFGCLVAGLPLLVFLLVPAPARAQSTPVAPSGSGTLKNLTIERVVGLSSAAPGNGSAQVRCGARSDGPDADDQEFPPPDVDEDTWLGETDLDCELLIITVNNVKDSTPQFAEGFHEAGAVLHFKTNGSPNTQDYPGSDQFYSEWGQVDNDDDPVLGNGGNLLCLGANATCAVGAPVFVMGGAIQKEYILADGEVTPAPAPGGNARAPGPDEPVGAVAFSAIYFTPDAFTFYAVDDEVTITPQFDDRVFELIHTTATVDGTPNTPASAPAALLSARSAHFSPAADALLTESYRDAATLAAAAPFLDFNPAAAAELTIAGASVSFGSLTVDRFEGGGAERDRIDLLTEYFASPSAVVTAAPAQAQLGYVPNITHREIARAGVPISAAGLDPALAGLVPVPVSDGLSPSGERFRAPAPMVGLLLGVEGSLLDALNLSADQPGTALNTLVGGLSNGERFTIDIGVASSSFAIAESWLTTGGLIDDFAEGTFDAFLNAPATNFGADLSPGLLGGQREISATLLATQGEGYGVSTTGGVLSHDQADQALAVTDLFYDGPDAQPPLARDGSLNLDLATNAENAFVIGIDRLEQFSGEALALDIGAFAILDDAARTHVESTFSFPGSLALTRTLHIPFHALGADLSDVAGVGLVVDGSTGGDQIAVINRFEMARVDTWPPTIDSFDDGALSMTRTAVGAEYAAEAIPLLPGGQREAILEIVLTEGIGSLDASIADGALVYHQGPSVFGRGSFQWDGPDSSPGISGTPLPGVDLAATGASAVEVVVNSLSFDDAITTGVALTVLLREPDPAGAVYEGTLTLDAPISTPTVFAIDLTDFAAPSGSRARRTPTQADAIAAFGVEVDATLQDYFTLVIDSVHVALPCGNARDDAGETCDDGNTASGDGCSSACQAEDVWAFDGTALGGSISFNLGGVAFEVSTAPGESAASVARNIATAISGDLTLFAQDITAIAVGDDVSVNAVPSNLQIDDAGIVHVPEPLPGLLRLAALGALAALATRKPKASAIGR